MNYPYNNVCLDVEHMIDTANKALSFVEGVSRAVFEMTFNNNHDNC